MSGQKPWPSKPFTIQGYLPGAIGRVTELHARYYRQYWGFDLNFEAEVATELSEFLKRFNPERDGFWLALQDEVIVGAAAIDGGGAGGGRARLRWFIVSPEHQGRGLGRRLMEEALDFCRRAGIRQVYLWTFQGLEPARRLYERFGFRLVEERRDQDWGPDVVHQLFELDL